MQNDEFARGSVPTQGLPVLQNPVRGHVLPTGVLLESNLLASRKTPRKSRVPLRVRGDSSREMAKGRDFWYTSESSGCPKPLRRGPFPESLARICYTSKTNLSGPCPKVHRDQAEAQRFKPLSRFLDMYNRKCLRGTSQVVEKGKLKGSCTV